MALMWNRSVEWDEDDWRKVAACRNTEPDLFFPIGTTGPAIDQIEAAKRVCMACEALEPCLEFALATNQESGIWGEPPKKSDASCARPGSPPDDAPADRLRLEPRPPYQPVLASLLSPLRSRAPRSSTPRLTTT